MKKQNGNKLCIGESNIFYANGFIIKSSIVKFFFLKESEKEAHFIISVTIWGFLFSSFFFP